MFDFAYELRKCKECSCSRCSLNGGPCCYIEMAIKELDRCDQAFSAYEKHKDDMEVENDH